MIKFSKNFLCYCLHTHYFCMVICSTSTLSFVQYFLAKFPISGWTNQLKSPKSMLTKIHVLMSKYLFSKYIQIVWAFNKLMRKFIDATNTNKVLSTWPFLNYSFNLRTSNWNISLTSWRITVVTKLYLLVVRRWFWRFFISVNKYIFWKEKTNQLLLFIRFFIFQTW